MEAIEEPQPQNVETEAVKVNVASSEANADGVGLIQTDLCHKSNGVAEVIIESERVMESELVEPRPSIEVSGILNEVVSTNVIIEEETSSENNVTEQEIPIPENEIKETNVLSQEIAEDITPTETVIAEHVTPTETVNQNELDLKTDNAEEIQAVYVEIDGIVETVSDNVRFETEVLIETDIDDQSSKYKIIYSDTDEPDTKNILNELGQNIELSEVLRSSDVTEHVENNNCEVRQEVFNNEELLDILEGNDVEESRKVISKNFVSDSKKLETQLALQQLSRLQHTKKSRSSPKKIERRSSKKSQSPKEETIKKKNRKQNEDNAQSSSDSAAEPKEESIVKVNASSKDEMLKKKSKKHKEDNTQGSSDSATELKDQGVVKVSESPKDDTLRKKSKKHKDDNAQIIGDSAVVHKQVSIVNALVKDWDDDEPMDGDQENKLIEEGENLVGESDELIKSQEATINENKISNADTSIADGSNLNKSDSETQPQRRLGRVIKKKVIFDPDNPDTFTKTKMLVKKENLTDRDLKEQPTLKKIKTDQTALRSKSKSPIQSKLQWKKPQPKTFKQNKRLTEIDRLLMDEGAVNMICQLTPEAPKGHKNMKSKAEFIKKIQRSTPEGNEMKFRERKKELRFEEGDPKRIGSGKERLSLNSSVKSPSVSEDFEAHSADDSIIYRRHSSSSYSSPCMSPRRMSDVETINQNAQAMSQAAASLGQPEAPTQMTAKGSHGFMSENVETVATGVINKSDLLSIKEKLNSKLSQALNKRKRDSMKPDKPHKIKKLSKPFEKPGAVVADYKYLKVVIDQKLAEICIQHSGSAYNVEVINELKTVLETVDSNNDVSVTLLSTESDSLCSGLQLKPLLDQEKSAAYAQELAESVRSLLSTLESHSKLVYTTVEDKCYGLGLSMVALSDVAVASERASFELSAEKGALLQPGAAVLAALGLSQSLLNEIILFERPISSAEALQGGLVSRTIWPDRFQQQARAIAKDIATQPTENIMLKKQLLRLKRGGTESFLAALDKERDLFIKYWTSTEVRELLRASLEPAKE